MVGTPQALREKLITRKATNHKTTRHCTENCTNTNIYIYIYIYIYILKFNNFYLTPSSSKKKNLKFIPSAPAHF